MEWLEWIKIISPIVTLVVSTLLGIFAFFGKNMIKGFVAKIEGLVAANNKTREDHEELEKEFLRFQAQLPRIYVLKDDHIRHITIVEKKIDDHANTTQQKLGSIESDIKLLLRESAKRKADG